MFISRICRRHLGKEVNEKYIEAVPDLGAIAVLADNSTNKKALPAGDAGSPPAIHAKPEQDAEWLDRDGAQKKVSKSELTNRMLSHDPPPRPMNKLYVVLC
jgi:hypothetical protein